MSLSVGWLGVDPDDTAEAVAPAVSSGPHTGPRCVQMWSERGPRDIRHGKPGRGTPSGFGRSGR